MPNQGEQQVPIRPRSSRFILRLLVILAATVVAMVLVVLAWDGTGAATGEIQMRVFLVGWTVAAVVVLAGLLFAGLTPRPVLPLAVQHVVMGVVIGLAAGTTDWATPRLAGWWQLWWTVPLFLAYAGLLTTLRRAPRARS